MSRRPVLARVAALGSTLACTLAFAAGSAGAPRVVVVQAHDTPRLAKTLAAFVARMPMPVDVLRLPGERDGALATAIAAGGRDTVVVALGPRASDFVSGVAVPGPVVHCLAGPDALRTGLPAVPSEAPPDQQALWLRKLVPAARIVGVLFDPVVNTRRAEAIAASLDIAGYKALLQPVDAAAALPTALAKLAGRADVLLAVPDRVVYAPEAANGILLFSFRHNIPLIGPNESWVRRGALFAVDWDYEEVGATCAALAMRETHAKTVAAPPPRPRVWVNTKMAKRFGLDWNPEILKNAGVHHE
jgi:putative ABC transport system substrate-binding protein